MTTQWMQMSGSYIKPKLLDAIFKAMDEADLRQLNLELKPLHELRRTFLK